MRVHTPLHVMYTTHLRVLYFILHTYMSCILHTFVPIPSSLCTTLCVYSTLQVCTGTRYKVQGTRCTHTHTLIHVLKFPCKPCTFAHGASMFIMWTVPLRPGRSYSKRPFPSWASGTLCFLFGGGDDINCLGSM